jgi:hypothetical protein
MLLQLRIQCCASPRSFLPPFNEGADYLDAYVRITAGF